MSKLKCQMSKLHLKTIDLKKLKQRFKIPACQRRSFAMAGR
ncbi:MAG: hypothetical protein ABIJ36_02625 [Patescibacteria group bacterium]